MFGTGTVDTSAMTATGWVIEDNWIHHNAGRGISAIMHHITIRNNVLEYNGQLGLGGGGYGGIEGANALIEGNEIAYNNTAGIDYNWEAGGTKFVHTVNLVVRNNYVHHNNGPGLWTDGSNMQRVVRGQCRHRQRRKWDLP